MSNTKLALMRNKLRPETESVFEDLKELQKEVVLEKKVPSPEKKKAVEKKKPGRKKKSAETKLSKRLVMLVSEADAEILAKKRGAGEIYEMDESLFLREWCKRKGLFDDKDIKKTPYENLPKD